MNMILVGPFPRAQSALDTRTTLSFCAYQADDWIYERSRAICTLSQANLGSHLESQTVGFCSPVT